MSRTKKIFLITFLFILWFNSFSQDQVKIDSLLNLIETSEQDSNLVHKYNNLAQLYYGNNPSEAVKYSKLGLDLAKELNFIEGIAFCANGVGRSLRAQGEYTEAMRYYEMAVKNYRKIKKYQGVASALGNIAGIHYYRGDFENALESYIDVYKQFEILNDSVRMALALNGIGIVYGKLGNIEKSLETQLQYLEMNRKLKNEEGIASGLISVANNYANLKRYEECISYYKQAIEICKKLQNTNSIALCYSNMGEIYAEKKQYDLAIEYMEKGLELELKLNNQLEIGRIYSTLGEIYSKVGKYDKAIGYSIKGVEVNKKIGAKDGLKYAYKTISDVYSLKKDYKNAYKYHVLLEEIKDSIFKENTSNQLAELESRFETHKKEKEIELLNKEKKIDQLKIANNKEKIKNEERLIYFLSGVCLLIFITIILIYNRYRIKRNANERLSEQNEEIQQQAEEIRAQHDALEELYTQLTKKNSQISDSINYAEKLQKALLTSEGKFKHYFEDSFIFHRPKDIVSGDFFWIKRVEDNILFAVADCTGHGVPGAFMSLVCHRLLENLILKKEYKTNLDSATGLKIVHQDLVKTLSSASGDKSLRDGMDIALCCFNRKTRKFNYSGAHNSILYVSKEKDEVKLLEPLNRPIGLTLDSNSNPNFKSEELVIEYGDSVYLYTDGFADQFGGVSNQKFFAQRFYDLLVNLSSKDIEDQGKELSETFQSWKGNKEQIDDVLVIGIRF